MTTVADLIIPNEIDFEKYLKIEKRSDVKSVDHWRSELDDEFDNPEIASGDLLPWQKCQQRFELRTKEVSLVGGWNGHRKSLLSGFYAMHLTQQKRKVLIASLEMPPSKTLKRMVRQASGQSRPSKNYRHAFLDYLKDKMWFFDKTEQSSVKEILGVIQYAAQELGVKHAVVDSLMMLDVDEEDKQRMKKVMRDFKDLADQLDIHITVIAHLRKSENESRLPGKFDVFGSISITNIVDNLALIWSDKEKQHLHNAGLEVDDDEPDLKMIVAKQRNSEFEGTFNFWIDHDSGQITENKYRNKISFPIGFGGGY